MHYPTINNLKGHVIDNDVYAFSAQSVLQGYHINKDIEMLP